MFKLKDLKEPFISTSLAHEYVMLSPLKLREIFGEPQESDNCRVSGVYRFRTPKGGVITLYDWKSTSLYDPEFPSPEEVWSYEEYFEFNIGADAQGKLEIKEFLAWIMNIQYNSVRFITEQ